MRRAITLSLGGASGKVTSLALPSFTCRAMRAAIHGRELRGAGALGGAVEVEVERRHVGDGVVEGREARGLALEAAAHARCGR